MGIFDRFRGDRLPSDWGRQPARAPQSEDEQAIARYRYMLKTAPPETVEQAHAEAFARLTPSQRSQVLGALSADMPQAERVAAESAGDSPGALARAATRAEVRQLGAIERALGRSGGPGGIGLGGMLAGSLLGSLAGTVLGTMVAQNFLHDAGADAGHADAGDTGSSDGELTAADDSGADLGGFDDGGGFDV